MFVHQKRIHKNHRPRFKKLGRRCEQIGKQKKRLEQTLQEVLLKEITELKKEEPQA
jgi:uncharacterized protein YdcH (DUF465 family)